MARLAAVIGVGAGGSALAPLIAAQRLGPTDVPSLMTGDGAALAHVSLGIGGEEGGVARRGPRILVIAGSVPGLGVRGKPLAERLLDLAAGGGPQALADLNGVVAACLWDEQTATGTLVNDRLGIGRLYYRVAGNRLLVASRARALAAGSDVDFRALGQLLQVGYPLEDRTLFPDVRLLPAASLATWHAGKLLIHRQWEPPPPEDRSFDSGQATECLRSALENAVSRILDSNHPRPLAVALPLSGGLDSRTLLGFTRDRIAVNTFSYGHEHSWDVRFGLRLARAAETRHEAVPLRPDYMARFGPRGVYLTDGEAPLQNFHILCLNSPLARRPHLVLSGFLGDSLTGAHLAWVRPDDLPLAREARARALFDRHYRIGFSDDELARVLRRPVAREASGAAFDAFLTAYRRADGPYAGADRVDLELRQRRLIAYQLTTLGEAGVVACPFVDHEVIDALLGLPLSERLGQAAYCRLIVREFPELARVPRTATGLALAGPRPLLALRQRLEWLRWQGLPKLTGGFFHPHDYRQYAHVDDWIRQGSRDFFAGLIEDRELLDDLFDTEQLADLFKAHLDRRLDAHGRLGAVGTFALLRRQMISGHPATRSFAAAAG